MKKFPTLISYLNYWNLFQDVNRKIVTKESIPTKYGYVGWHGALAWYSLEDIVLNNEIASITETEILINEYLSHILNIVSNNQTKKFHYVSLGIGTGKKDVSFLKNIASNTNLIKPINFYGIDISSELLSYGIETVIKYLEKSNSNLIRQIEGYHLDLDKIPPDFKLKFKNKNKADIKLLSLFGLTIGNNNETEFLKNILSIMNIGDYLLFDVDLSNNSPEELKSTLIKYKSSPKEANNFLLNSLYFHSNFNDSKSHNKYKLNISKLDNKAIKFIDVIHDPISQLHQMETSSVIPNSYCLTRRHVYKNFKGIKITDSICDYSTKYQEDGLILYLEYISSELGFEIIRSNTGEVLYKGQGNVALVLLKKVSAISKVITSSRINTTINSIKSMVIDRLTREINAEIGRTDDRDFFENLKKVVKESNDFVWIRKIDQATKEETSRFHLKKHFDGKSPI